MFTYLIYIIICLLTYLFYLIYNNYFFDVGFQIKHFNPIQRLKSSVMKNNLQRKKFKNVLGKGIFPFLEGCDLPKFITIISPKCFLKRGKPEKYKRSLSNKNVHQPYQYCSSSFIVPVKFYKLLRLKLDV